MEHLNPETLARLADEAPAPGEAGHLDACRRCREEVVAIRAQSRALSHLPDPRPPSGEWEALEAALLDEGLLRREPASAPAHSSRVAPEENRSSPGGGGWGPGPSRLQAAAAILLLVGGAGLGVGASALLSADAGAPPPSMTAAAPGLPLDAVTLAALDPSAPEVDLSMEEAEELVRLTEGWYLTALTRYRDRAVGRDAPPSGHGDPFTRYAALEALMAASQAAVREVPTDPFLNCLLVNMRAEREATLRGLRASSTTDNWY
jgi:hypothetical protein